MTAPDVRLDSLDPARGGRSFRFAGHLETLVARRLGEVMDVLGRVERAAAEGVHAVGFVAYEAAPAFDPALRTREPEPGLPLAWFALFRERLPAAPLPPVSDAAALPWTPDTTEAEHAAALAAIRAYLAAGDSYQVNHTFRLRAPAPADPAGLYGTLLRAQRGAFGAYLDIGSHVVVSASPELFFHLKGDSLTLRPMKGTRPRGRWPAEDTALADELVSSPKERAENLMIVDLLRNDAGRVAVPGSVRVERPFEVERYETVLQMTSTIAARVRPGNDLGDVFRALFPCGSVTGAPKVRTMQIISELERAPRGVYCGAIGMVSPGEAVFSVAIRTVVVDRAAGTATLGVGSGITWDSAAAEEYRESLGKAAFAGALATAFGLLETLRFEPGTGFALLDEHLRRMGASAERFGLPFDRAAALAALHHGARDAAVPARVRLVLARSGRFEVAWSPLRSGRGPVRIALAAEPVDHRDPRLFHKTTDRTPYERRLAAHPGVEDVILVNDRGELTESTIANLVVRLEGRLWTPPLDSGVLPGTFRAALLRRGEISERVLRPADLSRAEGIWLVNSVRGWRRAVLA